MFLVTPRRYGFVVLALLFCLTAASLRAQDCVCNGVIQPSAGEDCQIILTPADILTDFGNNPCPGPYSFQLFTAGANGGTGILLDTQADSLIIPQNRIGGSYMVVITPGPGSGAGPCMSRVDTEDKLAPTIVNCTDITLDCNDLIGLQAIITPVVTDNCSAPADLTVNATMSQVGPTCNLPDNVRSQILQNIIVTDEAGQTSSCLRTISFVGIPLADIDFPADVTIDCTQPFTTDVTGLPSFNGQPVGAGGFCGFGLDTVIIFDSGINTCPRTVVRQFTLVDNCVAPGFRQENQTIVIDDTTDPVLVCPADITIGNTPGQCFGSIGALPLPTVTDDCDTDVTITTTTTFADPLQIPIGTQTITYKATDNCGNFSTCSITLTVADTEGPTVICDQITTVSLTNQGTANVPASVFDDGSFDNCTGAVTFLASRDGITFTEFITFNCADVGLVNMVFLQVSELDADPLSDICMVEVLVEDKLGPLLACPADVIVECTQIPSNLDDLGVLTAFDPCGFTTVVDTVNTVANCGTGSITRTFTVTDTNGNSASCSQTITVINSTPFDGTGIVFPPDITIANQCLTSFGTLSPDSLPVGFQRPVLPNVPCAMLGVNFTDQFFSFGGPGCFKIVRTWTILDMCQFDPTNNPGAGIFTDQQIIKGIDTNAPVFVGLPASIDVSLDATCTFGTLDLTAMGTDDCATNLTITNDSPFGPGTASASGNYPPGSTVVNFRINDGCGNSTNQVVTINVLDLTPPNVVCQNGLIGELAAMVINGQSVIAVMVNAPLFDASSVDNCGGPLQFFIRRSSTTLTSVPTTTQLTFTCADLGVLSLDLYVVDEAGNADFCTVPFFIQDNMNLCTVVGDPLIAISGQVNSTGGNSVPNVHLSVTNSMAPATQTGTSGDYTLDNLPTGYEYTLVPEKSDDLLQGVTTYDLVLLSKHILGTQPFTTPEQYLAADVNNTKAISTLDLVEIRKAILYLKDEFTNNTPWRFVPADYTFPDPINPWATVFPEEYQTNMLYQSMQVDFRAIKVGDINGSATYLNGQTADDRTDQTTALTTPDRYLEAGEQVTVAFSLPAGTYAGAQLGLTTSGAELQDLTSDYLTADAINLTADALYLSWTAEPAVDLSGSLFEVTLTATNAGYLSELLSLTTRMQPEVYTETRTQPLTIIFDEPATSLTEATLYAGVPNPFREQTTVRFALPEDGLVNFTVIDAAGRTVYRTSDSYAAGRHTLTLRAGGLPVGLLFLRMETVTNSVVQKLVRLE